jgi:hypothetical protein
VVAPAEAATSHITCRLARPHRRGEARSLIEYRGFFHQRISTDARVRSVGSFAHLCIRCPRFSELIDDASRRLLLVAHTLRVWNQWLSVFRLGFVALREDVNRWKDRQAPSPARLLAHAFVGFPACIILHTHLLITLPSTRAGARSPRVPLIPAPCTTQGSCPRLMNRHHVQIAHSCVDCLDMRLPISWTPIPLFESSPLISQKHRSSLLRNNRHRTVPETITRVP